MTTNAHAAIPLFVGSTTEVPPQESRATWARKDEAAYLGVEPAEDFTKQVKSPTATGAATVLMTTTDALQGGYQLRMLSRDERSGMPDEVRDLLDRIGKQMLSAGRLALKASR